MFPLRDENPTELVPYITVAIIAINVAVWLLLEGAGLEPAVLNNAICSFGAIPGELTGALGGYTGVRLGAQVCRFGGLTWGALFTSMFLHGSWLHLLGNMWFLWIFGNNIEDAMGHVRYLVFYLLAGVIAAGSHVASAPGSVVPMVGASGAISGVMGAYLLLYPRVRVYTLFIIVIFVRIIPIPAWFILGEWLVIQVLSGATTPAEGAGVAFWAHIGGFVAGMVLVRFFERPAHVLARRALAGRRAPPDPWAERRRGWGGW